MEATGGRVCREYDWCGVVRVFDGDAAGGGDRDELERNGDGLECNRDGLECNGDAVGGDGDGLECNREAHSFLIRRVSVDCCPQSGFFHGESMRACA